MPEWASVCWGSEGAPVVLCSSFCGSPLSSAILQIWTTLGGLSASGPSHSKANLSLPHSHPFSGTGNFGCENIKAVSNLGTQRAHPTVSTSQASMSFIAWYSVLWNWFSQHLVVKGLPWICKALGVQSPALERKKAELLLDRLSFVFESFWLLQAGKQLLSLGLPSYKEAEVSKETRSLLWGLRTAFT